MNNKMVSIIMGTYNPDIMLLDKSIRSIINQTFSSWELLLYDDGSEDTIADEIRKLSGADPRIRYIRGKSNKGLAHALNRMISQSTGKYVARMDDDDISLPDRISEQVEFLEHHQEYDWVGCEADLIDDTGVWGMAVRPEKPDAFSFLHSSPFIHPSVLFRKEVLIETGGYCDNAMTQRCEDYELFMRLYAEGYRGYNLKKTLFQYRDDSKRLNRSMKYCIKELRVRMIGFKRLGILSINTVPYLLKPVFVGMISIMPGTAQRIRLRRNTGDKKIEREPKQQD